MPRILLWLLLSLSPLLLSASPRSRHALLRALLPPRPEPLPWPETPGLPGPLVEAREAKAPAESDRPGATTV